MGAYVHETWKKKKEMLDQVYQIFPLLKRKSRTISEDAKRWGETNAGNGTRVDVETKTMHV